MSIYNNADIPVISVQLNVIQQEITYGAMTKTIPESYWTGELVNILYPLWDSDKDKLIMFTYFSNNTYHAKRRKFLKNFKTNEFEWKDYEMEQVAISEAEALKDKLIEAFYLIDSVENQEFQVELSRMYAKQRQVSPFSVRLARNFLLSETDWAIGIDSPLSEEDKQLYLTYRSKLRDLTNSVEFSVNVEETKFPISPEFYKEIYVKDFPGVEYLSTENQFLPLGKHYLKLFKDKIANYLVLKSLTETNYFDTLLTEYEKVVRPQDLPTQDLTEEEDRKRREWLEKLLENITEELDGGES
jgi:hypothetical protein